MSILKVFRRWLCDKLPDVKPPETTNAIAPQVEEDGITAQLNRLERKRCYFFAIDDPIVGARVCRNDSEQEKMGMGIHYDYNNAAEDALRIVNAKINVLENQRRILSRKDTKFNRFNKRIDMRIQELLQAQN